MVKKKVVVAMSGGVDSSVAAFLLKEEKKYDVVGVNLKLFSREEPGKCCGNQNTEDARSVCQKLGIPFYSFDYRKEFKGEVIDYFCSEYLKGKTPNPCIVCNEKIKFGELLHKAKSLGADYIATGHYAKKEYNKTSKRYILKKGKDKNKDQSYFLFSLSQEQLKSTLFPLGDYTKEEVRKLAKKIGLKVHDKPESQDICFISGRDYHEFLKNHIEGIYKPGAIASSKGEVLGEHKGIPFYTVGQRKGLGLYPVKNKSPKATVAPKVRISNGAHKNPTCPPSFVGSRRVYVTGIDKEKNIIVIGEEKELYRETLSAEKVNWIGIKELKKPLKVKAKTRYRNKESEAIISPAGKDMIKAKFSKPQRAIAPGQAVVFYNKDIVIGGGWIV